MSLRSKLIAIVLGLALLPLAISAFSTLGLHQRGFEAKTTDLHRNTAQFGATFAARYVADLLRTLHTSADAIRWPELTPQERSGALWLIYRVFDETAVASLLDEAGQGLGPSAYVGEGELFAEVAAHPRATLELLQRYAPRIPLEGARVARTATGEPFDAAAGERFLPVAVKLERPGRPPWFLAAALSLRTLCAELSRLTPPSLTLFVADSVGNPICSTARPATTAALAKRPPREPGIAEVLTLQDAAGEPILVARAQAGLGWTVVVEQPRRHAFASSRKIRDQALSWIVVSAALALVAGILLARNIGAPIKRLVEGADQLAQGAFDHRLPVDRKDELGRLSEAFNRMGAEIQRRDGEIRAFNDELQRRVEDRTQELREAQVQLIRSQRLSAVSGLGAGMAHEINNPLAGVLGLAQILIVSAEKRAGGGDELELLRMLEAEAHRIREIVHGLQRLTESYGEDDFQVLEVQGVLDGALDQLQQALSLSGVEVRREYAIPGAAVRGNRGQLQEVFVNLLQNAVTAMDGKKGELRLSTAVEGGLVKIAVSDTGKGIAPEHLEKIFDPFFTTKDNWRGEGLGLTLAHRLVEQHEGRIKASSTPGAGTTMTITLPAAVRGTTLI